MTVATPRQLAEWIDADQRDAVLAALDAAPKLLHQHAPKDRPWAQEQWLPLHRAAARGDVTLVAALLDRGSQPDSRTRYRLPDHGRATAVHLAAAGGHLEVVRLLLERGGSLEVRDAQQRSPLSVAAQHGRADVVRWLAQQGAQLEVTDEQGRTPLHLAIAHAVPEDDLSDVSGDADANGAALALIEAGAYVNATCPQEPEGFTPLHRCVAVGVARLPVARRLIEAGADVAAFDPVENRTPLELAQAKRAAGEAEMVEYVALLG